MILNLFRVLQWLWALVSIPLAPFGRFFLRLWDAARTFGGVVWSARFSAFTLAAGGALLVAVLAMLVDLVLAGVQRVAVSPGLAPVRTSRRTGRLSRLVPTTT